VKGGEKRVESGYQKRYRKTRGGGGSCGSQRRSELMKRVRRNVGKKQRKLEKCNT